MKELIFRVTDENSDIEILNHDTISKRDYFSVTSLSDVIEKLKELDTNHYGQQDYHMTFIDDSVIGIGQHVVMIKQPEHKRIVTYKGKAYNIMFPNSIYIIHHIHDTINSIDAYCYKEYNGKQTRLYKYAMPNMLTSNRICMGSAPKKIVDDDYVEALERIIFTQYTHVQTDNIKSFKETKTYFEYLSKNDFPYDLLMSANITLREIVK